MKQAFLCSKIVFLWYMRKVRSLSFWFPILLFKNPACVTPHWADILIIGLEEIFVAFVIWYLRVELINLLSLHLFLLHSFWESNLQKYKISLFWLPKFWTLRFYIGLLLQKWNKYLRWSLNSVFEFETLFEVL